MEDAPKLRFYENLQHDRSPRHKLKKRFKDAFRSNLSGGGAQYRHLKLEVDEGNSINLEKVINESCKVFDAWRIDHSSIWNEHFRSRTWLRYPTICLNMFLSSVVESVISKVDLQVIWQQTFEEAFYKSPSTKTYR